MEPNKDKKPEKKSVRFIEGKGFYIALVLCAAVIGVSAWSLLSGTKTMDDGRDQNAVLEVTPAPTIPIPGDAGAHAGDDAGAGNSGRGRSRNGGAGQVRLAGGRRRAAAVCHDGAGL